MPNNKTVPFHPFSRQVKVDKSKRNLPHWEQPGGCYFITFRLADSLPRNLVEQLRHEKATWLSEHPEPWTEDDQREYGRLFTTREENWLDNGYGDCHLRSPDVREIMSRSLEKFDRTRYDVDCFVLMPNHIHFIWQMRGEFSTAKELKSLKGATARFCNKLLGRSGAFWMDESYDRLIRDKDELLAFRKYIESNPSKAALEEDEFSLKMNHRLTCY